MGQELRYGCIAALLVTSAVLAFMKRDGWGWFLFVGFLLIPGITHAHA